MYMFDKIALPMINFSHIIESLKAPNICIKDTGKSSHNSQYQNLIVNTYDGQDDDSIMIGSGLVVKANKIGNILGEVCDNRGMVLRKT